MTISVSCYDTLKSESPCTAVIAVGDFNPDSNGLNIREIVSQCRLKQVVKRPTRGNAILDLYIIMDIHNSYEEPKVLPPIGTSDHMRIVWRPKNRRHSQRVKGRKKSILVRPLRKSKLRSFDQFIREIDWSSVYQAAEVDDGVRIFLEVINDMFDFFPPCKSIKANEDNRTIHNRKD